MSKALGHKDLTLRAIYLIRQNWYNPVMLGLEAWLRPRGQNIRPLPRPRPRRSWPRPRPRPRGSGLGLESRGRGQSRGQDKIQCHKYKAIDYNKQRYPILD